MFLSSDSPMCMNNTNCTVACARAVTSKIPNAMLRDISNLTTAKATIVSNSESRSPSHVVLGIIPSSANQSFQVDEAEDENPNNV